MNIAVITFSDFNTNYGSILQAVGLKTYLESQGHTVSFIRYREFNKLPRGNVKSQIRGILIKGYYLLHSARRIKRQRNFQEYIKKNIPHTRLFTTESELEQKLPVYDAYICGSDQIWNIPSLGGLREPYFLKFAPTNALKIAYAPSMGEYKLEDGNRDLFLSLISDINYLSSRERNAANLLSQLTKREVTQVVDPTMLISSKKWLDLSVGIEVPKQEYGVCYFVRRNQFCVKMVKQLKKKYGIPIYNLSDNLINIPGTSNKYVCGAPDTFVKMVANARFCVGTSFHLAAFSTIFKKPCYIAETTHNKERIESVFSLTNSTDFLIRNIDALNRLLEKNISIEYTKDYKNFVDLSQNYLKSALK